MCVYPSYPFAFRGYSQMLVLRSELSRFIILCIRQDTCVTVT